MICKHLKEGWNLKKLIIYLYHMMNFRRERNLLKAN